MCDRLYIIIHSSFHFCKFNQLFGRWISHLFLCAKVFETIFFLSREREIYVYVYEILFFCLYLFACYRIQRDFFFCSVLYFRSLRSVVSSVFCVSLRKVVEALSMTAWLIQFYLFSFFSYTLVVCVYILQIDKVQEYTSSSRSIYIYKKNINFCCCCSNSNRQNKMRLLRKNGNNLSTILESKQWKASLLISIHRCYFFVRWLVDCRVTTVLLLSSTIRCQQERTSGDTIVSSRQRTVVVRLPSLSVWKKGRKATQQRKKEDEEEEEGATKRTGRIILHKKTNSHIVTRNQVCACA